MSSLVEYVKEYGTITFSEKKLCVEDLLVLSQFTYLKFGQYVPGIIEYKNGITIKALSSHPGWYGLFEMEWFSEDNCKLFEEMAVSSRFQNILLRNYTDVIDKKYNIQFAAITFILPDGNGIVSFRGTDEFLAGWIEDSRLAFDRVIPGQEFAGSYLRMVVSKGEMIRYIIGHSKGGNLAEFAAVHAPKQIYYNLKKIYNFDGPAQKYRNNLYKIRKKYYKLVPKESVVGMLFENPGNVQVVASYSTGIMQHNLHSWMIKNGRLQRIKKNRRLLMHLNKINIWMKRINLYQLQRMLRPVVLWMSRHGNDNLWVCVRKWRYHTKILYKLRKTREVIKR